MNPRFPSLTLALAAATMAVPLLPGAANWLQYDRAALTRGEVWRVFTAHLAHCGPNHLLWDLGVLLVLGCTTERQSRHRFAVALAFAAASITPALRLWQPQFRPLPRTLRSRLRAGRPVRRLALPERTPDRHGLRRPRARRAGRKMHP